MIDKLINFLVWARSKNEMNVWIDRVFSYIFLFVIGTLLWSFGKEFYFDCTYSYYTYNRDNSCSLDLPWDGWFGIIVGVFFSLGIVASFLYGAFRKTLKYEYSIFRLLLNTTIPFFVGLTLLTIWTENGGSGSSYGPKWYIYLFGGLYAFSPIIHFLKQNIQRESFFKRVLHCYSRYIVSFLIGLAIFIVLFGLGNIIGQMRYLDFAQIVTSLFIAFCVYGMITWLILSYAWDEVKPIDDDGARSIRKWGIYISALFLFIWLSPNWKEVLIDDRIGKAEEILLGGGNTYKEYQKAASIWGLKWAMKERYLDNRLYNKDLYAQIFDRSIESDIDDELDVNDYRARSSNGTSALARGENAKVELNFAKHESEVKSDIGAIETTITYEFQNTDTQNQEVIYSIELPSSDSVVTDLKLGLNLELPGLLAPRGAAEQVYNDSLRRNTDPALLEQTGPTTYRLRVFPVLSVNEAKTGGKQRVAFTYVTPITSGDDITVMPKTDILNLKLTKKSEIMTRVMEGTKALLQESVKTDDINDLIAGKTVSVKLEGTLKNSDSYCAVNNYEGLDMKSLSGSEKTLTKNIVFLDISKSAGDNKSIKERYQELIDAWKNNGAALDIYTFNTVVTSAGYDLSDIDFWGTTDMTRVIAYITENAIANANIVILTDDNSYELALAENKTIDYKKLKSNRISLIQIGEDIRTLKTEVTKSILASEGDVLRLAPDASLDEGIKSIFAPKKAPTSCESYTGTNTGTLSALEGNRDGRRVFGENLVGTGISTTYIQSTYIAPGGYFSKGYNQYIPGYNGAYHFSDTGGTVFVTYTFTDEVKNTDSIYLERGYYIFSGTSLEKVSSGTVSIHAVKEIILKYDELLEKIGETAHIVNQSMSLIALETDRQRQDLERYSNQADKYDTDYQNFDNTASSGWGRREVLRTGNMDTNFSINIGSMEPASSSRSSSANSLFGASKATSLNLDSSNSSIGIGTLSLSSGGGGGGSAGALPFILIIILFPAIAWYVLRKKKPQAQAPAEAPLEEKKAE